MAEVGKKLIWQKLATFTMECGLQSKTGGAPWAALTATANTQVVEDIMSSLRLRKGYMTFKLPCFRSNLFYDVQFKDTLEVSQDIISMVLISLVRMSARTWLPLSRTAWGRT